MATLAILIVRAVGPPGLWDVEFSDGSWKYDRTIGQVRSMVRPGFSMAVCPGCHASRWYGEGPCSQCGVTLW